MTVERLHPVLAHHVVNSLGWRSLRPLQQNAIAPILDGEDAVLLAPTAGGKTEAAVFPLLTSMEEQGWRGLSVLYVCPLKALLNNLAPRVESYAEGTAPSHDLVERRVAQIDEPAGRVQVAAEGQRGGVRAGRACKAPRTRRCPRNNNTQVEDQA